MKNNDFDFIKNKFENAQPEIPEKLDSNIIKQKILSNENHKIIKMNPKRNYFKPTAAIAACFVLVLGLLLAVNPLGNNGSRVATFSNYEDVHSKITELEKISSVSENGCGSFHTTLQRQEQGVEMPDVVKTDGEYIYYAYYDVDNNVNRNKVYIYKTADKEPEFVSVIDKLVPDSTEEYSDLYEIENLFVHNNRLVIFIKKSNPMSADKYKHDFNAAIVKIYDLSDKSNPALITEYEQSGEYSQARMIHNILYVTSDYNVETEDKNYTIPWIKQDGETAYASAKNIACFENAKTAQYAVIGTIDVTTGEMADDLKAVLGGSAKIHCTEDYIYINEYIEGERYGEPERDVAAAMKLNLKKSKFTYASEDEVKLYSNSIIDIGRGNMYDSLLYPFGDYFISLGMDMENYQKEIILYDKDMNELDSMIMEDDAVSVNTEYPCFDENTNTIIFPAAYLTGNADNYHYQGIVAFEIKDSNIVLKNRIIDTESLISDDNRIFTCTQAILNGYVYSFVSESDSVTDNEKLKVFSYKY